ncbi:MAG: LTA synthase family protein [Oscillospiraceae bacterium]|nr:LTA synthase family protein [Oscillospiraceae bacterium]
MERIRRIFRYSDKAALTSSERWLRAALAAVYLLLASLLIGVAALAVSNSSLYGERLLLSIVTNPRLLALNILPVLALTALGWCLSNRAWVALLVSGVPVTALGFVSCFKLTARNDPLLASDIVYVTDAAGIASKYDLAFTPLMWLSLMLLAALVAAAALFFKARCRRWPLRLAALAVLCVLSVLAWRAWYTDAEIYTSTENLYYDDMSTWNATDQYCGRGFFYPLLYSTADMFPDKPDGYDAEEAAAALAEYETQDIPDDKKVNFVSIMLEAYFDFSEYEDIFTFETDPYEFWNELQSESVSGELVTNIFAGGTLDTELCYITGETWGYSFRSATDSYARWFSSQGYYTEYCHPSYNWFYNRQNIYDYLGFDSYRFREDSFDTGTEYMMYDDLFLPRIAGYFTRATKDGTPYFNFSVTYQNHGPYDTTYLYDKENEYISHDGISDESYYILNNYFWGIKKTDEALQTLVEFFETCGKPVVLVLFGDHKPWLGYSNSVYQELGIDFGSDTDESYYNYYNTRYIIWANDEAKAVLGNDFCGDGGSFSPNYLMMKVLDLCGYSGDSYTGVLREMYDYTDVINSNGTFRVDGKLTDTLSGTAAELYTRFTKIQYYRMFGTY